MSNVSDQGLHFINAIIEIFTIPFLIKLTSPLPIIRKVMAKQNQPTR
jgi:hypothetical protein